MHSGLPWGDHMATEGNQTSPGGWEGALDNLFKYFGQAKDAVFSTYSDWQNTFGGENDASNSSNYAEGENYNNGWSNPAAPVQASNPNMGLYIGVGVALLAGMILITRK